MVKNVTFKGLAPHNLGYLLTYNLKYYKDTDASPPDLDIDKSTVLKEAAPGLTNDQIVNRGLIKIGKAMQKEINDFKRAETAKSLIDFASKATLVEDSLDG